MKFKIGDRVRAIKESPQGKIGTIVEIWSNGRGAEVAFKNWKDGWGQDNCHYNMENDEIELISHKQFTKSDLKDGDIVTYRNKDKRILSNNNLIDQTGETAHRLKYYTNELKSKDRSSTDLDIIKVERPVKYETVYERKEEILDKAEKRYLRDVIRPFKDKVRHIRKQNFSRGDYITINVRHHDGEEGMDLPYFDKDTMYKGMRLNEKYTLKNYGL